MASTLSDCDVDLDALPEDPEWQELHQELEQLPDYHSNSPYVRAVVASPGVKVGQIIGSITTKHPHTAVEAVSCYCRMHQCKPPPRRAVKGVLHTDEMLRWFKQGQELGIGAQHRAAHTRILTEMYRNL